MPFPPAAQPDIIRAHQKDDVYVRVRGRDKHVETEHLSNLGSAVGFSRRGCRVYS